MGPADLLVKAGECVALLGPSGCGKTLFLRAICDLDPHSGLTMLGEVNKEGVSGPIWRRLVGFLAADNRWWYPTVQEHFLGASVDVKHLQALGLEPECLKWPVSRLSSGEKQRLALVRLLHGQPSALLLDEPTANLDPKSVHQVESLLNEYREKHQAPVIWVTHDPAQAARIGIRTVEMNERGTFVK